MLAVLPVRASHILDRDTMPPLFEWDENKARLNLRKHRVTFIEAVSVFEDALARIFDDPPILRRSPAKSSSVIR